MQESPNMCAFQFPLLCFLFLNGGSNWIELSLLIVDFNNAYAMEFDWNSNSFDEFLSFFRLCARVFWNAMHLAKFPNCCQCKHCHYHMAPYYVYFVTMKLLLLQHFVSKIALIFPTCAINYSYCCLYEIVFIITIFLLLFQSVKMTWNYIYIYMICFFYL